MLRARTMLVKARCTSKGTVATDLRVQVLLAPRERARIEVAGTIGDKRSKALLVSDGMVVERTGEPGSPVAAQPAAIDEALVVGVVRMGVLHNAARVALGSLPDHADGGVRPWAISANAKVGEARAIGGATAAAGRFGVGG